MVRALYHGTSINRLEDIRNKGLRSSSECPVKQFGCKPGIYVTSSMTDAAFYAAQAIRRNGGEAQVFLRTTTGQSEERNCCPHFDEQDENAFRLTGCVIPPEDLEICILPNAQGSSKDWGQFAEDT